MEAVIVVAIGFGTVVGIYVYLLWKLMRYLRRNHKR